MTSTIKALLERLQPDEIEREIELLEDQQQKIRAAIKQLRALQKLMGGGGTRAKRNGTTAVSRPPKEGLDDDQQQISEQLHDIVFTNGRMKTKELAAKAGIAWQTVAAVCRYSPYFVKDDEGYITLAQSGKRKGA